MTMNDKYRGTSHRLFIDTYLAFTLRNWEKQWEISVTTGNSLAIFESYTCQLCYHCSSLFSTTLSHDDYTTTVHNVIQVLLHPVALCNFDLGIMIPSGATTIYVEVPLLEGTFYVLSHYMFWPKWPSSGVTG
jgi:hypothetical protein